MCNFNLLQIIVGAVGAEAFRPYIVIIYMDGRIQF
jgi:hypothetical protein